MTINAMGDAESGDKKVIKKSEVKDIGPTENTISSSSSSLVSSLTTGAEIQKNKKKLGYILLLEQTKKILEKIHKDISKLENKSSQLQQELAYYQKKYDMRSAYYDKYMLEYEEKTSYFNKQAEFYRVDDINLVVNAEIQETFLAWRPEDTRESQQQILTYLYSLFIDPVNKKSMADYAEATMEAYTKKITQTWHAYAKNEQKIDDLEEKYISIQTNGMLDAHLYTWKDVSLDDFVASEEIVRQIKKIITLYKQADQTKNFWIPLSKSILLSGDADTGKTFAAKVLASEIGRKMYHIKAHDLFSEDVLDPNGMLYFLFSSIVERTQQTQEPCIIFLDEIEKIIDSMWEYSSPNQKVISNTIIKNITNIQKSDLDIIVLAAVGKKNAIDPRFLKYDLFPKQIYFSHMDPGQRRDLFTLLIKDSATDMVQFSSDIDLDQLVKKTEWFSSEYIKKLISVSKEDAVCDVLSVEGTTSSPCVVTHECLLKNIELLRWEDKSKWNKKYL